MRRETRTVRRSPATVPRRRLPRNADGGLRHRRHHFSEVVVAQKSEKVQNWSRLLSRSGLAISSLVTAVPAPFYPPGIVPKNAKFRPALSCYSAGRSFRKASD